MSAPPRDGVRRPKGIAVLSDGRQLSYFDYLRSPEWEAVKAHYRMSKLPQTCFCGAVAVDFHHRTYKNLGNERLMDLVPLCRDHHDQTHLVRRRKSGLWAAHKRVRKRWEKRRNDGS